MEELIKTIEERIEDYNDALKSRPDDQWLKGYIYGMVWTKQEIEKYKSKQ